MDKSATSGVNFQRVNSDLLPQYASIPMKIIVKSVLNVTQMSDSYIFNEETVIPYTKDYDAFSRPTDWPTQFDIRHWGIFLAYINNNTAPIAGAAVTHNTNGCNELEGDSQTATLWDIRVHPAYQRQGLARSLFNRAVNFARDLNCTRLLIETQHVNVAANLFYQSVGCTLLAINPHAYKEEKDIAHEIRLDWVYHMK